MGTIDKGISKPMFSIHLDQALTHFATNTVESDETGAYCSGKALEFGIKFANDHMFSFMADKL